MKTALILIDIQNDYFPGGKIELPGMDAASQNAAKLLAVFRQNSYPIFYIQHIQKDPRVPIFVAGTSGVEIHKSVQPQESDKVIQKNFPNSFYQTNLLCNLRDSGVGRLVICGAMSNMCIDATARAAIELGFHCVVVHDACAANILEFYGRAISAEEVHGSFMAALTLAGVKVMSTSEALVWLNHL